jgi:TetR/AcrR family transcriptional regulator, cholesterol catabolism regulator
MAQSAIELAAPALKKSERTRKTVLDAAARLFASKGYAGTNLTEIAAAAGIKTGSLYYHFASKEELVYEVLRYGVAHSFDHTRAEVERLGPRAKATDQLRAAIRAHLDSLHELGDYTTAGLRIVEQAPVAVRKRQYANQKRYGAYWQALLERAHSEGALARGVDLRATRLFLIDAMNGTASWPASALPGTDALTETLLALLLRG